MVFKKETKQKKKDFRIAVFDDSDISRKNTIKILNEYGFNVVGEASTAKDATNSAIQSSPDLCLVDLIFPKATASELIEDLTSKAMVTYFVVMSPLNIEKIALESISSGAIDFLPKPINEKELITAVAKIEREFQLT